MFASLLVLLAGCVQPTPAQKAPAPATPVPQGLNVSRLDLGADISALDAPGRGNWGPLPVYQENGVPGDELSILSKHGWSAFRVRVFVSPVRNAPNNTLEAAIPLAKRIKAAGATFLLCIHLSDTWADPQHQEIPVAWRNLDFDGLIIESHIDPDKAWSDAKQQITPAKLGEMMSAIRWRKEDVASEEYHANLEKLRQQINQLDDELMQIIGE